MAENKEHQNNLDIWTAVFNRLMIDKGSVIVDLCPGDDPKVELALGRYGFRGELIAIDASQQSLDRLRGAIPAGFRYETTTITGKLQDVSLPVHNHITGNHLIDDLMSFEFCRRHSEDYLRLFRDTAYSRLIWDRIAESPEDYEHFVLDTMKKVSSYLPPGGYLILSQYPSKFERLHDFSHETALCQKVFNALAENLCCNGLIDVSEEVSCVFGGIRTEVYKPEHWKVLKAVQR